MSSYSRRCVLKSVLGVTAAVSLPRWAAAASTPVAVTALNDSVNVVSGVGGNVVTLSSNDGMLLIDSGAPDHTKTLQKLLKDLPGGSRVQTLLNTHWHWEQTGGNEAFGALGARIIAHEKTRQWLVTDHWLPKEERYEKARPKTAHPTESFYTRGELVFGKEHVEYGYLLEAHTAGDLYVLLRDSNVLAVGDAVAPDLDPSLDWYAGGWLGGRLDALALLLTLSNENTKIIAGTGPVIGRAQVQAEHDMLLPIFTRIVELMRKGYTTQAMLDEGVLKNSPRPFKDPAKFMYDAHKGIWAHHNTLAHEIV